MSPYLLQSLHHIMGHHLQELDSLTNYCTLKIPVKQEPSEQSPPRVSTPYQQHPTKEREFDSVLRKKPSWKECTKLVGREPTVIVHHLSAQPKRANENEQMKKCVLLAQYMNPPDESKYGVESSMRVQIGGLISVFGNCNDETHLSKLRSHVELLKFVEIVSSTEGICNGGADFQN